MLSDGSIRQTDRYAIARFENNGFRASDHITLTESALVDPRLDELAQRLIGEISSFFILYNYFTNVYTDNDEVIELLKEWYPSGEYHSQDYNTLNINFDEILSLQANKEYKWSKYIPRWNTIYRKLAIKLFNLNKNPFKKSKFIGNTLYELCFQDEAFRNKNEWIKKFRSGFGVESLDPIHIFASLNSNKIGIENRIERINILFRLLDKNSEKYSNIDFSGCPSPTTIHMIGARDEDDQEQVWNYFFDVIKKSQKSSIDFEVVKSWYGIDIGSFTIFLFWIDSKNFIPLDKYTMSLLEKYSKLKNTPTIFKEYISLLIKNNTNLYRNLALVAYDSSQQELLNNRERDELEEYLIGKNRRYAHTIVEKELILPIGNEVSDEQQSIEDVIVHFEPIISKPIISDSFTIDSSNDDLKLISLKPLEGCSKDYLKTLKENENYVFDKAYSFESDEKIVVNKAIALSLYDIHNLKININAIVGKNGTGKSTLVELLFAIINNLACKKNINNNLELVPSLKAELLFEHIALYKITVDNDNVNIYQYEKKEDSYINPIPISINEFDLNHLFYMLVVNYSQHSLNWLHLGSWLNALFHKNDAYQTPIVIEPFRKDGNVDINRQNDLVKQRLLSNLLELEGDRDEKYSFRSLTEYYKAVNLKLTFNKKKFFYTDRDVERISHNYIYKDQYISVKYISCEKQHKSFLEKLYEKFGFEKEVEINFSVQFDNYTFEEKIHLYILKKSVSIAVRYEYYQQYFDRKKKKFRSIDNFINDLYEDKTHIAYKLKQAINFLRFNSLILKQETEQFQSIEDLSNDIYKIKQSKKHEELSTIELIPPSFFNIEIFLDHDNKISFNSLSSGEKQKIFSINSILYHLNNLNSVDLKYVSHKYKYVNIVLDEVELYFHPELQRTYLSDLHNALAKVNYSSLIGLNICFVTHSPFILSDIPNTKILFLEKESNDLNAKTMSSKKEIKTLGANIHELLINGFFMNSSMGDFASQQIEEIIKFYNSAVNSTDESMETLKIEYAKVKNKFHFIQEYIGEDYINGVLESHIEEIETRLNVDGFKQKRIERLEAELNALRGS